MFSCDTKALKTKQLNSSLIQNMKRDRRHNVKNSLTFKVNCKKTNREVIDTMRKFNANMAQIQNKKKEIKEARLDINKFYRTFQGDANTREPPKFNKVNETFRDLIRVYKARGYKVPNLSVDKNLFKPSPLLLENSKVFDYFKYSNTENLFENKDREFLLRMENQITDKIIQTEENPIAKRQMEKEKQTNLNLTKKVYLRKDLMSMIITEPQVIEQSEIKELKDYNIQIKELIKQKEIESYSYKKRLSPEVKKKNTLKPPETTLNLISKSRNTRGLHINLDLVLNTEQSKLSTCERHSNFDTTLPTYHTTTRVNRANTFASRTGSKKISVKETKSPNDKENLKKTFIKAKRNEFEEENLIRHLYRSRREFLDFCFDDMKLTEMSHEDLRAMIKEYCRHILRINEEQIEKIFKMSDSLPDLLKTFEEIKGKVDYYDVATNFKTLYSNVYIDRSQMIKQVKEVDRFISNLSYYMLRKLGQSEKLNLN